MEKIKILGVNVDMVDRQSAKDICIKKIENNEKIFVVTPNSEIIYNSTKEDKLFDIINSADLVVPDGIGLVIASKILKKPLKERVTGVDMTMALIEYANENNKTIFFLGGKKGTADMAKEKLEEKYKNIKIVGTAHGYYKGIHNGHENDKEEQEVIEKINAYSPDMLFVALGSPAQEYFIAKYKDKINAKLFIGVGGTLDVISGNVKRAPEFYQKHGLEWLYRIIQEPKRMGRAMALPKFAINVLIKRDKRG